MAAFKHLFKMTSRSFGCVKFNGTFKTCAKHFSSGAYDPDGKTVLTILNNDDTAPLMIDGYSVLGFRLNNGLFVIGPIAIFPHSILSWNIEDDRDINERSLSLFLNLSPKLDILIVGLSDATDQKHLVNTRRKLYEIMKSKGQENINFEVLPTEKAVTTFNFLNSEKRFVGAALVPPTAYAPNLDDEYRIAYLTKKKDGIDVLIE